MKVIPFLFKSALIVGLILVVVVLATLGYVMHRKSVYQSMKDTRDLKARIEQFGISYLNKRPEGGVVVGIYQHGRRHVEGFGKISTAEARHPDGKTLFEIGSVTKVLTGLTLAKMVVDGTLFLNDPISRYLPEGVVAPQRNGREITLENLATHTSGLPRLPENFMATVKDEKNPYANFKVADLYASLATVKLSAEPGTVYNYSNYGFGLLGHLLELKTGKPYAAIVRETLCEPLAMTDTAISLSAEQKSRLTPGHNAKGLIVPNWDVEALAGADAFFSDADDMLNLLAANLEPRTTPLSTAFDNAQKVHFKKIGGGEGLGWAIVDSVEKQVICWKNGGAGGYTCFVGFDKINQIGVVILSNYGDFSAKDWAIDETGMELLKYASKVSFE